MVFSVPTELDQIMFCAAAPAEKVQLHLPGTREAKTRSSETLFLSSSETLLLSSSEGLIFSSAL